jgi:phosphotransferase system enzyme I (PtsP)
LRIGTMLEVPALMWRLPDLLKDTDFVSVGTNDLLQFLFAADRGTPSLYDRYDFLSAPVLNLLEQLVVAARLADVPLSVCGEAASRPLEALVIAALGIPTLSMPASGILPIKAMFSQVNLVAFQSVLTSIRRGGGMNLREPIATWAREHGILG